MTENQGRATPNPRRETENMRAELIVDEMASAVKFLGGEGSAKDKTRTASRETRLSPTVIERLRWRKIKRIPADIADVVREAVNNKKEKGLSRAEHELILAKHREAALLARLAERDPHGDWPAAGQMGRSVPAVGRGSNHVREG